MRKFGDFKEIQLQTFNIIREADKKQPQQHIIKESSEDKFIVVIFNRILFIEVCRKIKGKLFQFSRIDSEISFFRWFSERGDSSMKLCFSKGIIFIGLGSRWNWGSN